MESGIREFSNLSALRESGYTIDVEGGPVDHGFDYYYGIPASLDIPPYFYIENSQVVEPPADSVAASQTPDATTSIQGAFWRAGKAAPSFEHAEVLPRLRDKAISFIEESQRNEGANPFSSTWRWPLSIRLGFPPRRFKEAAGPGCGG